MRGLFFSTNRVLAIEAHFSVSLTCQILGKLFLFAWLQVKTRPLDISVDAGTLTPLLEPLQCTVN